MELTLGKTFSDEGIYFTVKIIQQAWKKYF